MDSAWKVGAMTGSLDVSIRIKQNASLSNTVSCLAHGIVVIEKGTSIEPKLRVPLSAQMGEKGMIVVSSDGLFELRDVDVLIESTLPSFVFLFGSESTIVIKDGSFVGPSDSTEPTHNENDADDSSVCSWETGLIQLDNCITDIDNTKLSNLAQGAIRMKAGNLTIETTTFHDNSPRTDFTSSARRNIDCSEEGHLVIGSLSAGDGTPTLPSPWISANECTLTGLASVVSSPLFVPSLKSDSNSTLNKKTKMFSLDINGSSLFDCGLSLEVFEVKKTKAEGQSIEVNLTKASTTSFSESRITLSLPQSQNLERSLEWRGRLIYGNEVRTKDSFLIQSNSADRMAQSVLDNMKWWIPLVVCLICLALLLIVVIVCCRRRQKNKSKDQQLVSTNNAEMDTLQPDKIEVTEDWNVNLPQNSILVAGETEGPFSKADTTAAPVRSLIEPNETVETGKNGLCAEGLVIVEGEAMQTKPLNRKDTLYNRLHTAQKIPITKLRTAKQIAHTLAELQKVTSQLPLLSRLSSHFVLFDENGNVQLDLSPGKNEAPATLVKGQEEPQFAQHVPHTSEFNEQDTNQTHTQSQTQGEGFELLRWRAPEATQTVGGPSKEFDHKKAAVFSLGLVLFEIESETVPMCEMDAVNANRQLGTGNLPKMELIHNVALHELITSCLSLEPSQRPNLDSIERKLDSVEFSAPKSYQISLA
ncbi:hypothetical protein BLNAU_19610 [Blattamonas nauphoetae]|uniref:Serine-threonine/tyrosine-protein kinase catalytic domain-containing protein n=1 Tax=Blattamonas nauphoetae TaxID=2049346 RepID=A0ABQ9X112_9EUKA|nr:hypothetical protein BLNAU_19610 [Blattamonas nauphoetae]